MPFIAIELWAPNVEQQNGSRLIPIVPSFMTYAIVECPAAAPLGFSGILANTQPTALGNSQRQMTN
jgi:hypothetical protein